MVWDQARSHDRVPEKREIKMKDIWGHVKTFCPELESDISISPHDVFHL